MSDYGKSQHYVYGKYLFAHLMFLCGSHDRFGPMGPLGRHVRSGSKVY